MAFSTVLLLIFAISIGYATFIENDFGREAARLAVYNAKWFELLLLLLVINMFGSLFKYNSFSKRKWGIVLFHLAFVVMIIGAGITRYFGHEGMMHIREGESSNFIVTENTSLKIKSNEVEYSQPVDLIKWVDALEPFNATINGKELKIIQTDIIPNATRMARPNIDGKPTIAMSVSDSTFKYKSAFMQEGSNLSVGSISYSFDQNQPATINFKVIGDSIYFKSNQIVFTTSMTEMTHEQLSADTLHKIIENNLYQYGNSSFVVKHFYPLANVDVISMTNHQGDYPLHSIKLQLNYGDEEKVAYVYGSTDYTGDEETVDFSDASFKLQFGPELIYLPYSIRLEKFTMDRYANSMSPSSFKSDITLIDSVDNKVMPYSIFMNNVLNHKGYRFFQTSYDQDEKGTLLSVNYDPIGTFVSYFGYFLMTLGMFLALFSKKSYFRELLKKGSKAVLLIAVLAISSNSVFAQNFNANNIPENKINTAHAERFGHLLIADPRGRIKPVNTLASEVTRKIMKKKKLEGYTPTELFLSMITDQLLWADINLIKISNSGVREAYNFTEDHVSYYQLVFPGGKEKYILKEAVDLAYNKEVTQRNKYDKEILKLDERVNLYSMIYFGDLLHIFPVPNDKSEKWASANETNKSLDENLRKSIYGLYSKYYSTVRQATVTGNWKPADAALDSLFDYQLKHGGNSLPSANKINAEVFYNKVDLFSYASKLYLGFGIILLIALFMRMFNSKLKIQWLINILFGGIVIMFILHTAALSLRWYISGHAPWSNGYETTLFIAWASVLAGISFAKRSPISLSVTAILSAIFILISSLSWMDPEITNLVPVLKSYWLVIHVAVITSSYGFFALSMLMGILNLFLILSVTKNNNKKILPTVSELSSVIQMAMIIGMYLLTVGTFLGAVWANESWGRYWGWDPKETWALVTIIVYNIVTHLRHIPGMKSTYVVSAGAVLAFGSVLMTYFGVNYFLSGMHSYGAGDAFVIPFIAKFIVLLILILVVGAGFKHANNNKL